MANEHWLKEKIAVGHLVAHMISEVLWEPLAHEATADTDLHHIHIWKEGRIIRAEVEKVR